MKTHHFKYYLPLLLLTLSVSTSKATFLDAATETTQIPHLAATTGGWLNNAAVQAKQYATELNSLKEHIMNNDLTRSIKGLNELQTTLQGDISDVLGTVSSLGNTPMGMINDLRGNIPTSVNSIVNGGGGVTGLGGNYSSVFKNALSSFSALGAAGVGDGSTSSPWGGAFKNGVDFQNQVSGLRTGVNTEFLNQSAARQAMYNKWSKAADTSTNSVQMQKQQLEVAMTQVKNQNRDQEMAALDRVQQSADRAAAFEEAKAKAVRDQYQSILQVGNYTY